MYLPEEFIIIGAALEVTPQGARLKNKVTNDDINRYRRTIKFQIDYDEEQKDFEYFKWEDSAWLMIKQPPLTPQLVQILVS